MLAPLILFLSVTVVAFNLPSIFSHIDNLSTNTLDITDSICALNSIASETKNLHDSSLAQGVLDELVYIPLEEPASVVHKVVCHQIAEHYELPKETLPSLQPEDLKILLSSLKSANDSAKMQLYNAILPNLNDFLYLITSPSSIDSESSLEFPNMSYWEFPKRIQRKILNKYGSYLVQKNICEWLLSLIKIEGNTDILSKVISLLKKPSPDFIVEVLVMLFGKNVDHYNINFFAFTLLKLYDQDIGFDDETLWTKALNSQKYDSNGRTVLAGARQLLLLFSARSSDIPELDIPTVDDPLMVKIYLFEALLAVTKFETLSNKEKRMDEIRKQLFEIKDDKRNPASVRIKKERPSEVFKYLWSVDAYRLLGVLIKAQNTPFKRIFFQNYSWFKMRCQPNSAITLYSSFSLNLILGDICDSIQKLWFHLNNLGPMSYDLCDPNPPTQLSNVYSIDLSMAVTKPEKDFTLNKSIRNAFILMKASLVFSFKIPLEFANKVQTIAEMDLHDVNFIANNLIERYCQLDRKAHANVNFEITDTTSISSRLLQE